MRVSILISQRWPIKNTEIISCSDKHITKTLWAGNFPGDYENTENEIFVPVNFALTSSLSYKIGKKKNPQDTVQLNRYFNLG